MLFAWGPHGTCLGKELVPEGRDIGIIAVSVPASAFIRCARGYQPCDLASWSVSYEQSPFLAVIATCVLLPSRSGSRKTRAAYSNGAPCFSTFCAALRSSLWNSIHNKAHLMPSAHSPSIRLQWIAARMKARNHYKSVVLDDKEQRIWESPNQGAADALKYQGTDADSRSFARRQHQSRRGNGSRDPAVRSRTNPVPQSFPRGRRG